MQIETKYAKSNDVHVAYQVLGQGTLDLVWVAGWASHLDHHWQLPGLARYLRRLASFSRLIAFDKRGTGLSDRVAELPTLEQRMDDVRAVMDAVGSERALGDVGRCLHVRLVRGDLPGADRRANHVRCLGQAALVAGLPVGSHA